MTGPSRKLAIKYADKWFALWVKASAGWGCAKCGRRIDPEESHRREMMECSHYADRDVLQLRWNEDNGDCLDRWCHAEVEQSKHDEKGWYRRYKIRQVGLSRVRDLENIEKSHIPAILSADEIYTIGREYRRKAIELSGVEK